MGSVIDLEAQQAPPPRVGMVLPLSHGYLSGKMI